MKPQPGERHDHEGRLCGQTRKFRFKSHAHAMQRAGELMDSAEWKSNTARAYHCMFCNGYHLTSAEKL